MPGWILDEAYKDRAMIIVEVRDVVTSKVHKFTIKLTDQGH